MFLKSLDRVCLTSRRTNEFQNFQEDSFVFLLLLLPLSADEQQEEQEGEDDEVVGRGWRQGGAGLRLLPRVTFRLPFLLLS